MTPRIFPLTGVKAGSTIPPIRLSEEQFPTDRNATPPEATLTAPGNEPNRKIRKAKPRLSDGAENHRFLGNLGTEEWLQDWSVPGGRPAAPRAADYTKLTESKAA